MSAALQIKRMQIRDYLRQAGGDHAAECLAALDAGRLDVLQGLLSEPKAWPAHNLQAACFDFARRALRAVRTADLPSRARWKVAEWRAELSRDKLAHPDRDVIAVPET